MDVCVEDIVDTSVEVRVVDTDDVLVVDKVDVLDDVCVVDSVDVIVLSSHVSNCPRSCKSSMLFNVQTTSLQSSSAT